MRQQKKCCPIQFKDDFEEFIEYLRLRPLRESTIKYQHDILIPILLNFDSYGVKSWNELSPTDIYRVYQESGDKYNLIYPLRSFLQFLQKTGRILKDYTVYIPKNKKRYPTPSVYSKDEIKKFLESFDLDNPFEGKVLLGKLFKKSKTIRHKQQVRERVRVRETSSDSFYDRKFIGRNV